MPKLDGGGFRGGVAMENRRSKRWMSFGAKQAFGNTHRAFAVSMMLNL